MASFARVRRDKTMNGPSHDPLVAYSLSASLVLDMVMGAVLFVYGVYEIVWIPELPVSWVMSALFFGDFYFRLWQRPVRQARFFEDHFEISGFRTNLNSGYDSSRILTRNKHPFGDFRSNSRVSFYVQGASVPYIIPNRWSRGRGMDMYSLISKKAPNSVSTLGLEE